VILGAPQQPDNDRHPAPAAVDAAPASDEGASALSAVPAAGSRRGMAATGSIKFFYGPMDCGKSTLALQLDHNHSRQGRQGLLLTRLDRSRTGQITSRMGLSRAAVEADDALDIADLVRGCWAAGRRVDYVIVDEAQFFTAEQVEQLARLADDVQIDVYAFGIATDFRGRMFPGSMRLFELADEAIPLQVEVLCWCGRPARFNARVVDGVVATQGAQVVVADTAGGPADVRYQVLCRAHHRTGNLGPASGGGTLPLVDGA
jgi:thymidine kinase